MLERIWRKGNPFALLVGMYVDTAWSFLNKLGIKLLYDPAILLLGIYPEKTITEKDLCPCS